MKRCGFCIANKRYENSIKNILKIINNDFFIYTKNTFNFPNVKSLPEINFNFVSCTEYDTIMPMLLAKLKIFSDLSKQYDQVFNLDLDITLHKDLTPILDKYSDNYLYGCLEDTNKFRLYERRKQILKAIGISEFEYINAGFMILNFEYEFDLDEVKYFFGKFPFSNCPEQDFLNWKFKDKIRVMPNYVNWNKLLPFERDRYITHYLGYPKPKWL